MFPDETANPAQTSHAAKANKKRWPKVLALVFVAVLLSAAIFLINPGKIFPGISSGSDDTAQVVISNDGVDPATIEIKKGQSVQWVNNDGKPHQIASDPYPDQTLLPGLDSEEPLTEGETYSFTFEKTGTFTYHDHLNPSDIKGTVIVK